MQEAPEDDSAVESTGDDSGPAIYRCSHCKRPFKRLEHMKRHEWCHTGWKRFRCEKCGKSFTRSDALGRHEATHELTDHSDQGAPFEKTTSTKRLRACIPCARARDRCSKTHPCRRCQSRSINCIFPGESSQGVSNNQRDPNMEEPVLTSQSARQHETPSLRNEAAWPGVETDHMAKRQDAPRMTGIGEAAGISLMTPASPGPAASFQAQSYGFSGLYGDAVPGQEQRQPDLDINNGTLFSTDPYNFPMNWLPASGTFDMVYESMLGLDSLQAVEGHAQSNDQEMQAIARTMPEDVNEGTNPGPSILPPHLRKEFPKPVIQSEPRDSESPFSPHSGSQPSVNIYSPSASDATSPDNVREGLYATSAHGARVPCTIRSRGKWPPVQVQNARPVQVISKDYTLTSNTTNILYRFPSGLDRLSFVSGADIATLEENTYAKIQAAFHTYCRQNAETLGYSLFRSDEFPSRHQFDHLVAICLQHLAHILPIIHPPSLNVDDYWPLTLAMAAIGSQYTRTIEFQGCVRAFHEFTRRVLAVELQKVQFADAPIQLLQALVLNQVGMLYHGNESLKRLAIQRHGELTSLARVGGLLQEQQGEESAMTFSHADTSAVKSRWLIGETRRRVGYSIWWLDCLMEVHFELEATLHLGLAHTSLPQDDLWASNKEGKAWCDLLRSKEKNPSLAFAVHHLFREKHVKPDLGEFSRILILHGVYQEVFQTKRHTERALSNYIPSAAPTTQGASASAFQDKDRDDQVTMRDWKNAALDCVDALHWDANAVIALSRGAEHPAVMHLHLSRVILLVPYSQIVRLATFVSQSRGNVQQPTDEVQQTQRVTAQEAIAAEQEIVEWVQRDEFKARLAALHSGCLYWHLRRYSSMSFYEPISLFLATLTLWAYSRYSLKGPEFPNLSSYVQGFDMMNQDSDRNIMIEDATPELENNPHQTAANVGDLHDQRQDQQSSEAPREYIPQPHLRFIHLDRPCDDEIVQSFVRVGRPSNITAHITGVGDLSGPEAPVRILREGMRILDSVSLSWGRSLTYRNALEALQTATAGTSL